MLNSKTYDLLKWLALIFIPAFAILVNTVGNALGWEYTELATVLVSAFQVFLGSLLGVSNVQYNKNKEGE